MLQTEEKKKKISAIIFFLQHFTSSKLSLKMLEKWLAGNKHDIEIDVNPYLGNPLVPLLYQHVLRKSAFLTNIQGCKQLKSSSHTGSGLVFLLTTLGLFCWDFSLLKGKPSVCFYYEMPSILLISGCPQAPSHICQQRRAACGSTRGAADPWIPTSDPRMLPAAVCALPASEWHLHPQTRVTPSVPVCLAAAGAFLLNDPLHGKGAVNNLIYLSILLPASYRG